MKRTSFLIKVARAEISTSVAGWTESMPEARPKLITANIERTARGEPPISAIDLANA